MTALCLAFESLRVSPYVYAAFIAVVLILLALDLGVFHRKAHAPSMRESLGWTFAWISLALAFGGVVFLLYDHQVAGLGQAVPVVGSPGETMVLTGMEATKLYLTAYLVEKSLSMDNVFVIAMIFASLAIPATFQHRVLFWGILGALIMRGLMIGLGAAVVAEFSWIVYVFGGLLIFSAIKMALAGETTADVGNSRLVRLVSAVLPVSRDLEGQKLVSHVGGRWHATPLLVALIVVEATDVLFAVDSIPAVFAITGDPFIVFTSNIMAILGLRALYFCLASAMTKFQYLKTALIAVLLFVGIKICLVHTSWKVPADISMAVVLGLLGSGITASIVARRGTVETPIEEGLLPDLVPAAEVPIAGWRRLLTALNSNRTLRRTLVLTIGSLVLIAAVLMAPLPGPGTMILAPLGIGIIASEFLWSRRAVVYIRARERGVRALTDRILVRISRLVIVPAVAALWLVAWLLDEHTRIASWVLWSAAIPIATPMCYVLYRWHKVRAAKRAREQRPCESAVPVGTEHSDYRASN